MKRHSDSCSCTNCAYKSRSKSPSVQQIVADGTRIDKLYYGKYLPLRERKLLEKLVITRAVYDNVKDRLLSSSGTSDQTRSEYTGKRRGYYGDKRKRMVDEKEIRSSNTSKLSSCCNCCSCSSLRKIKESIEKHPHHVHKHCVPYENIAKYKTNAEMRSTARRRRLGSKISEKIRDLRYKSKNIRSDPCFCTVSLMKFSSKRYIKKFGSKEDGKENMGPPMSFAELEVKNQPGQKLRSIKQSIVNSIDGRFKIKKDSLSLFRAKLRKRALRRRTYDSESYTPEFRPGDHRGKRKSHHRLSHKNVSTSSFSKSKLKSSAVKMKSKSQTKEKHKTKPRKILNQETQASFLGKIISKPSQYQQRKLHTSSSKTTASIKTSSKSGVQTQFKPKSIPKHTRRSSAQSNPSLSLKKNQTKNSLRRCFCTLKLQKKKKKTSSISTQRSNKENRVRNKQTKYFKQEHDNVPIESLVSLVQCECAKIIEVRNRKNRKFTNTKKILKKSTSSLIFEGKTHTRQEKTQSFKRKNKHARGVEVPKPRVSDVKSQVAKSNETKPTNTVAFWQKCFCSLKIFNKDISKKKANNTNIVVKTHNKMTTPDIVNLKYLHDSSSLLPFECEPGICVPDQCNIQECERLIKARHTRSKNKYSDTSTKNIVFIHENPNLLPYECEPGVCIPDQCNPYECEKLINRRNVQHKNKYQDTNINTRNINEISKQVISSKTQQSQSQTRNKKKMNRTNHHPKELESNVDSVHSNKQALRIGSNFSFNLEFYKERLGLDSGKEISTSKVKQKQKREKTSKKHEYTKPRHINIKTRGSQSITDSKHIALSAVPKTKKRNVYVGSPKKTCLCTLKLHKKGRNAKNKENKFLTSKSTKTLQLFEPGLNASVIKSTNTSKLLRHELKSYECTPGFCVPDKCDLYKFYDAIKRRDMKRYRGRHIATQREKRRSVVTMTSSDFSSSVKSRSTQSNIVEQSRQERVVKKRQNKIESNYSPSRQAIQIGSNFSFNIDFYKDYHNQNNQEKIIPTMYNTVGNLTYISKIKHKSSNQRQYISNHHLLHASDIVKTKDKGSIVGNMLKRCICSLMLQSKEYGAKELNSGFCTCNPKKSQFSEVLPSQKYKKAKSQNEFQANIFESSSHSSYDKFRKYYKSNKSSTSKLQQCSEYQVRSVLNDALLRNNSPFYKSYYALNLKVSQMRKIPQVLEDDECEPGFCVPYQCDTVECLKRIKSRFKSWKETETDLPDTKVTASMTDRKRLSHNYAQADKRSVLKVFQPTKRKKRYGSSVKLNMSLYTHSDDTSKEPAKRAPIPTFYDMHKNKYEDENVRNYDRPTPIRSRPRVRRSGIYDREKLYLDRNQYEYKQAQYDYLQREEIMSMKHKPSKMTSIKKYAPFKFRSQDKQSDNMFEAGAGETAMMNNQGKISKHIKLMDAQTEPVLLHKYFRKNRKTTNIQTEPAVTKSTDIGKDIYEAKKSMYMKTQPAVLAKLIRAGKSRKSVNIVKEPEIKSIYLDKSRKLKTIDMVPETLVKSVHNGKSRKLKNLEMQPEGIVQPIQTSKSRKSKNFEREPEIKAQPIQYGKSHKAVHIADPEVMPKVIYSGKYRRTVNVPTDPNELPKSIYKGKYRERIYNPMEPEILPRSTSSRKHHKLMNLRTDRASRLARSRRTKLPEDLEKFLMKPPRRRVYTIGSSINFSMQFYKEDDSLAVDGKQKPGQTDASSGIVQKIRCFCTSKKRDHQDKAGDITAEALTKKETGKSKVVKKSTKSKLESGSNATEDEVSKKSGETESEVSSMEEESEFEGSKKSKKSAVSNISEKSEVLRKSEISEGSKVENLQKSKKSKLETSQKSKKSKLESLQKFEKGKSVKGKLEDLSQIMKSKPKVSIESRKGQQEMLLEIGKGKEVMLKEIDKSKLETSSKIEKSEHEYTEENKAAEAVSKTLGIKSICKCKKPVCTCDGVICECKRKEKGLKSKYGLCDCEASMKPRLSRSRSTKVSRNALSMKSDVLSYDKSTLTGGKRFSKSFYQCEPHVCVPGVCDPNVCYKIFKSKRRVKDISISATKDVKSKLVGTPFLTSLPMSSSTVKRCFCILKLKNRQAKNMIGKSFSGEMQDKKSIQQLETQNFMRKSFGKLGAFFKKTEVQKSTTQIKLAVNTQQGKNTEKNTSHSVKYGEEGLQQYMLEDSLPEAKKRKSRNICKCQQKVKKQNLSKKNVCECVQQYLDSFEPETVGGQQYENTETVSPIVPDGRNIKKIDQKLVVKSKRIKAIPPRLSQSIKSKLAISIRRKPKPDKTKQKTAVAEGAKAKKIKRTLSSDLEADIKSIKSLSLSIKNKRKHNIKKEKPTKPKSADVKKRKSKYIKQSGSSESSSVLMGKQKKIKSKKHKSLSICTCPPPEDDISVTDILKKRISLKLKKIRSRVSQSLKSKSDKIKQKTPKGYKPTVKKPKRDVEDFKVEGKGIPKSKKKKTKPKKVTPEASELGESEMSKRKDIRLQLCDRKICEAMIAKNLVCECEKTLKLPSKGICECKLQDLKDLEEELPDSEIVKKKKGVIEVAKKISRSLKLKSPSLGINLKKKPEKIRKKTEKEKKKGLKTKKGKRGIDEAAQSDGFDTTKRKKKKSKPKKSKLSIDAASQSEEPESPKSRKKERTSKIIEFGPDVVGVKENMTTESKIPAFAAPVLGINESKPKSEKHKTQSICKCLPEVSKPADKRKPEGICECPINLELPPPTEDQLKNSKRAEGRALCECLETPGTGVSGQIKRLSLKAKSLSVAVGDRIKRISGVNIEPILHISPQPESPKLAVVYQKPPDLAAGDQIKSKLETKPETIKLAAGDQKPKELTVGTKPTSLLIAPPVPVARAGEMIRKSQKIDHGLKAEVKSPKSKSIKLAIGENKVGQEPLMEFKPGTGDPIQPSKSLKRLSLVGRNNRKSESAKQPGTLAVCPCCGKSNIQSQEPSVCECHKSDTSFFKCLFKKKTPPPQPTIPGLEKVCPVCLRRSLNDVCTCGQPLSSKKVKGAPLPAHPLQDVCPECSKKNLAGVYPPASSRRQSYAAGPNLFTKTEEEKSKRKKGELPPPPIFSMVIDATNMKVRNKEETYRNLGIGCKDKLHGRYLPPAKKGQEIQPSIDLVIDRDNACILRPDNMMQPFSYGDKMKYMMTKGGESVATHSVACPFCNPLPAERTTNKRPPDEQHDKHCTCCICIDKEGKRKKGHPKNCTCCICRYGCHFGPTRRKHGGSTADNSKFPDKGVFIKYGDVEKPKEVKSQGKKGEKEKKGHAKGKGKEKSEGKEKGGGKGKEIKEPEEPPGVPVTLQVHNTIRTVRNLTKFLRIPKVCFCGLGICAKEIKKMEEKAASGLKGDIPPPCVCGSSVCKKKHTKKTPYYKEKEKKRLRDEKRRREMFKRWKAEALARIKKQEAEDAAMRRRIKHQDKKAMEVVEKYIDDTNSWVLLAENASEIGRFGINTVRRMITSVKRCVRHPLDICYRAQIARADPHRAAAKALEEFQGSGYSGTAARVRQRCAAMQTSKYLISAMEKNAVTNFLYHFRDRDPKKRLLKRKPEKEPPEVECSPFLTSLRQKPCLWLYRLCPWFYPHCLGLLAFWRQFTDVILFLLAVAVWSPCILLTEFCRTVMCCLMCAGGG